MFGVKTIRKLLLTAVVAALATMPVAAESSSLDCDYFDVYGDPEGGHLFCADGKQIYVCRDAGGNCAVSCGKGFVSVGECVQ